MWLPRWHASHALIRPATQLGKSVYEAIVVGTGFGGAVAACRLAQAGIGVGVLERGRRYPPGTFPRHVRGCDGLLWERGKGLYDIRPLNSILVDQAAGYGGGSLVYANVQMRPQRPTPNRSCSRSSRSSEVPRRTVPEST